MDPVANTVSTISTIQPDYYSNNTQNIDTEKIVFLRHLDLWKNSAENFREQRFEAAEKIIAYLHPENTKKVLNLQRINLESLPPFLFEIITDVTHLYLQYNNLKTIPSNISNLKNLNTLNIKNNTLYLLPQSIDEHKNLETLIVSKNKISDLIESVSKLENLIHLDVSSNYINFLRDDIYQLKKLAFFNISNNKLYSLPKTIGSLSKLNFFDFSHNMISEIPYEINELNKSSLVLYKGNPLLESPQNDYLLERSRPKINAGSTKKTVQDYQFLADHIKKIWKNGNRLNSNLQTTIRNLTKKVFLVNIEDESLKLTIDNFLLILLSQSKTKAYHDNPEKIGKHINSVLHQIHFDPLLREQCMNMANSLTETLNPGEVDSPVRIHLIFNEIKTACLESFIKHSFPKESIKQNILNIGLFRKKLLDEFIIQQYPDIKGGQLLDLKFAYYLELSKGLDFPIPITEDAGNLIDLTEENLVKAVEYIIQQETPKRFKQISEPLLPLSLENN